MKRKHEEKRKSITKKWLPLICMWCVIVIIVGLSCGKSKKEETQIGDTIGDTTPPSPPSSLSATPSPTYIKLQWTPSSSEDVEGYKVYRSTAHISSKDSSYVIATVQSTQYEDDDVDAGVIYYYRVTAVDGAGNESEFSNEVGAQICPDADGDGYKDKNICPNELDCDDTNRNINPGAVDIPDDGIDQNCDGQDAVSPAPEGINEPNDSPEQATAAVAFDGTSAQQSFHRQNDEDWLKFDATSGNTYVIYTTNLGPNVDTVLFLYNTDGITELLSDDDSGEGYASKITFQAPTDGTYYIKVIDKNGSFGENNTYEVVIILDNDTDGYPSNSVCTPGVSPLLCDCNDGDPAVNPGAVEICDNGIDDNCNGYTDSNDTVDTDKDGYSACAPTNRDCNDNDSKIHPGATEGCDDVDNNCNFNTDEGCDDDGDDFCDATMTTQGTPSTCPFGGGDCNDNDPAIKPSATEICDGKDNNCDGKEDYVNTLGDLDNTCGTDTTCLDYYCNEGVECTSAPRNEGATCDQTACGPWSTCSYPSTCAETGTQTRTCTDYICVSGSCQGQTRNETSTCTRDTDGQDCGTCSSCSYLDVCDNTGSKTCPKCSNGECVNQSFTCPRNTDGLDCGICKICQGGTCSGTPSDDTDCGTIDCDGLDTQCRNYNDLTSNRCEGFGNCKDPNTTSDCTVYTNQPYGTSCGSCSYNSCTDWTGSVYCTRTGGSKPICNGSGACSATTSCSDASCWDTKCSGGSCVSSSEVCNYPNHYDDTCNNQIDEHLNSICASDSHTWLCESNESEGTAYSFGYYDDTEDWLFISANMKSSTDNDWYKLHITDTGTGNVDTHVKLTNLPSDYDLYVYYQCDNGLSNTEVTCDVGSPDTSGGGRPGCKSEAGGNAPEEVDLDVNCIGTTDESGWLFIRVMIYTYAQGCYGIEFRP